MTDPDSAVAVQIVEAARKQFLRFGYSRVSTEEIARSVGRSKKTLYKHFATKEILLQAAFERIHDDAGHAIAALLAGQGGDRLARLRAILTAVSLHMAGTHRVLLADLRACSPDLGLRIWREDRQFFSLLLAPVLREAVGERVARADLPIDDTLSIYFSCVEGLAARQEALVDGPASEDIFGKLANLMVDGMRSC